MQNQGQKVPLGEPLQNGPVDIADVLLEDVVEVTHRLMQVQTKDESNRGHALTDHE